LSAVAAEARLPGLGLVPEAVPRALPKGGMLDMRESLWRRRSDPIVDRLALEDEDVA
jgi:hypothetical protein